jgi:hypothetical protein
LGATWWLRMIGAAEPVSTRTRTDEPAGPGHRRS